MARLLQDRYVAYDDGHGCDLVTGDAVRIDALPPPVSEPAIPELIEVLDDARDGRPRWIVADAANAGRAAVTARGAASAAWTRGFVPIQVQLYERLRGPLAEDLADRTLLLIGSFSKAIDRAHAVLLDAASRTPRPHVLLTFRVGDVGPGVSVVREARAAYGLGPATVRPSPRDTPPEIARHLERAARAGEFQRIGRHAAAERLLRDVAAALIRRSANVAAAQMLISLGRLLLERGRADAADKAFGEAATLAAGGGHEGAGVDARIWQALARTDAGRFTDAESLCRAVLLAKTLTAAQHAWANASLVRVLCLQRRFDETVPPLDGPAVVSDPDALVAASNEATAIRALVARGDVFNAGLRARALVARTDGADPLVAVVAATAHLRVLAAAGDLHLAEQRWREIALLARRARSPLRALRARVIWHDALHRSGRTAEARRELAAMVRLQRAAPRMLRRAIEERSERRERLEQRSERPERSARFAVHLISRAYEDEDDATAVKRALSSVAAELLPSRVELISSDGGPISTLLTVGTGLPTRIGQRALEAGIPIEAAEQGGRELAVPVRFRSRLIGALAARWPLDRHPTQGAADLLTLAAAVAAPRVDALLARAREIHAASSTVPELVGVSAAMNEVRRAVERAARAPFSVLVEGESGVGKELAARAIHSLSVRRERRFCDLNCAALPEELLESELFGHAKGAFSGAVTDKPGLFEEADGGTLFLDEIADLSPRGQAKLLRALQQQEVRRVGETFTRKVEVRLVAAANRDMRAEAAAGRFRADLLFRIDVIHLRIPPLRERPEDIPLLAQHCWRAAAERVGSRATLTHGVLAALSAHSWPGNVRELQNVMAALAVGAPSHGCVRRSLLPAALASGVPAAGGSLMDARVEFERRFVQAALARTGGRRSRTAAELGLSRQGLLKTMARLGIGATDATGCSSVRMGEGDR
jgi:DNA-binding NtrC family response regulator/tetratricopeptide (TPR) repeat protein